MNYKSRFLISGLIFVFAVVLILILKEPQPEVKKSLAKSTEKEVSIKDIETLKTQVVVLTSPNAKVKDSLLASTPHLENLRSLNNLRWTFGGKQQRGWQLYVPLISELVKTDAGATSTEFATKIATWQRSVGLPASGILDADTLMTMVKTWQERRSTDRTHPTVQNLITVPATEFFDTSRSAELRQVERETYAAYKRLLRAATRESSLGIATTSEGEPALMNKSLRIISAFRSRKYQDRLRRESPHSGHAGLAINSPHFTGRALDLYIAGEPVETKDSNRALQVNTPLYRWLVKNAGQFGFHPYFYEPWHWEYDSHIDTQREQGYPKPAT